MGEKNNGELASVRMSYEEMEIIETRKRQKNQQTKEIMATKRITKEKSRVEKMHVKKRSAVRWTVNRNRFRRHNKIHFFMNYYNFFLFATFFKFTIHNSFPSVIAVGFQTIPGHFSTNCWTVKKENCRKITRLFVVSFHGQMGGGRWTINKWEMRFKKTNPFTKWKNSFPT